jgi:uncharacterized membrane protein
MAKLLRLAGPATLALSGAILGLCWERIPQRWVTHWGLDGMPDGWAARSAVGVFSPLVLGLVVWGGLELFALVLDRNKRHPELGHANALAVRAIGAAVTSLMAASALVLPLVQPARPSAILVGGLGWVLGVATFALVHVARTALRLQQSGDARVPEGWNGVIYRNPNDPRIFVRKLVGIGYTLNFAHPVSWLVLVLLLVPPTLVLIAGIKLSH